MNIAILASGSKGNSTLIYDEHTRILFDMGISTLKLKQELKKLNLKIEDLDGIFITHEHIDHIRGLSTLSKNYNIPVFTRLHTIYSIEKAIKIHNDLFVPISKDAINALGNFNIYNFSTSHDAVDSCGYYVENDKFSLTIVTDLGIMNNEIKTYLEKSNAIILEANYDEEMLKISSYPQDIKNRIKSRYGHLSNKACGEALTELKNLPKHIILAHISEQNNTYTLAKDTILSHLHNSNHNILNTQIAVATQKETLYIELETR